uniref:SWIM-type zinc finger 7 associated protein 1 n=1 Tax=Oryzias latipes TaxID=8090 RepID=A0A3P9I1B9_ORYLA
MTDILSLVFRTFMSQTKPQKEPASAESPPSAAGSSVLLVGDRGVSSSLLLLAAITAASEMGIRVAFFTQTQIQSLPETLRRGKTTFFYPRTLEQLLLQVASLHESPPPPSLIVVDRLESFLRGPAGGCSTGCFSGEQSSAARLSALLCDTAAFLTQELEQRGSTSAPCRVIASYLSEEDAMKDGEDLCGTDPVLDVLDRYFQVRCTLDRDRGYEAAAAAVQEVWHVFLSGRGITDAFLEKDGEEKLNATQEWQMKNSFPPAAGMVVSGHVLLFSFLFRQRKTETTRRETLTYIPLTRSSGFYEGRDVQTFCKERQIWWSKNV